MALKINKAFLLVLFLLLLNIPLFSSSGMVEGFKDGMHLPKYSLHKDGEHIMKPRKLLGYENAVMLDYDDAGANPKHDPPKKKPGGKP